jgi:hypothetical protein
MPVWHQKRGRRQLPPVVPLLLLRPPRLAGRPQQAGMRQHQSRQLRLQLLRCCLLQRQWVLLPAQQRGPLQQHLGRRRCCQAGVGTPPRRHRHCLLVAAVVLLRWLQRGLPLLLLTGRQPLVQRGPAAALQLAQRGLQDQPLVLAHHLLLACGHHRQSQSGSWKPCWRLLLLLHRLLLLLHQPQQQLHCCCCLLLRCRLLVSLPRWRAAPPWPAAPAAQHPRPEVAWAGRGQGQQRLSTTGQQA